MNITKEQYDKANQIFSRQEGVTMLSRSASGNWSGPYYEEIKEQVLKEHAGLETVCRQMAEALEFYKNEDLSVDEWNLVMQTDLGTRADEAMEKYHQFTENQSCKI